jgi:hypothetical protein
MDDVNVVDFAENDAPDIAYAAGNAPAPLEFRETPGFAALTPKFSSLTAFVNSPCAGPNFKELFTKFQSDFVAERVALLDSFNRAKRTLERAQTVTAQDTCFVSLRVTIPKISWDLAFDDVDSDKEFAAKCAAQCAAMNKTIGAAFAEQQSKLVEHARTRLANWEEALLADITTFLAKISPRLPSFTISSDAVDDDDPPDPVPLPGALAMHIADKIQERLRVAYLDKEVKALDSRDKERQRAEKRDAARNAAAHLPVEQAAAVVVEREVAKQAKAAAGREASTRARIDSLEAKVKQLASALAKAQPPSKPPPKSPPKTPEKSRNPDPRPRSKEPRSGEGRTPSRPRSRSADAARSAKNGKREGQGTQHRDSARKGRSRTPRRPSPPPRQSRRLQGRDPEGADAPHTPRDRPPGSKSDAPFPPRGGGRGRGRGRGGRGGTGGRG